MKKSKKEKHVKDFIETIKSYINYWEKQDISSKEKLAGFTFSFLCLLDGVSDSFQGDISTIEKATKEIMLHNQLFENKDL